jgi:hypothetical protein
VAENQHRFGDYEYYEHIRGNGFSERFLTWIRDKIYCDFISACSPSAASRILDVGVSQLINRAANVLERRYPYQNCITAAGLGAGEEFRRAFPKVRYVQVVQSQRLPFDNLEFDIATSNAVLEHVGGIERQKFFLNELLRIAACIYVIVPNRYFPLEHHTAIPFLHFTDATFRLACAVTNNKKWIDENNLRLMTKRRLIELVPVDVKASVGYTGLKLGPFSSNLYLLARREGAGQSRPPVEAS